MSEPYHHGDLRAALIKAGTKLVRERGPEGATIRAAAKEVGVSHAAPRHHFALKARFLDEVAAAGFELLSEELLSAQREATEPLEQVIAVGLAYFRFAKAEPNLFRLMSRWVVEGATDASMSWGPRQVFDLLTNIIEEGQAAGQIRPLNPAKLALATWSGVHGFAALASTNNFARDLTGPLAEGSDVESDVMTTIATAYVARL